jgi:hypothetical protein
MPARAANSTWDKAQRQPAVTDGLADQKGPPGLGVSLTVFAGVPPLAGESLIRGVPRSCQFTSRPDTW